jgi:hypothetical protein
LKLLTENLKDVFYQDVFVNELKSIINSPNLIPIMLGIVTDMIKALSDLKSLTSFFSNSKFKDEEKINIFISLCYHSDDLIQKEGILLPFV